MTSHDRNDLDLHLDEGALAPIDRLMTRVVDGEANGHEWSAFADAADRTPRLWRELACQQRDATHLVRAVARRLEPTLNVQMPEQPYRGAAWTPAALRSVGWAAAAMLALAWGISVGLRSESMPTSSAVHTASLFDVPRTSDELFERYIDLGQREGIVVGELPTKLLIESRELAGGGFEVLFVRPVIERRVVPTMYGITGIADDGLPRLAPVGHDGPL